MTQRLTTEGARRLGVLADFLEPVPPDNFFMGMFFDEGPDEAADAAKALVGGSPMCGTTACAGGWACAVPEFQLLGLRLAVVNDGCLLGEIQFGEERDFDALCAFFECNDVWAYGPDGKEEAWSWLFGPGRNRTPREEAALIRAFIKEHTPQPEVVPVPTGASAPRVVRHRRVERNHLERTAST